ncbi:hypothetical protein TraAM80_07063 [Trypanosoma rangeli]|uniref:Uncharacterized protein n=1 Tax=Trypanosoma rangeli TaxID=5698 RepID=A0A422N768_TRYRA|nr:uncharacterized protein TraAM80_07063 [Trypanosoma rangeli]RNF01318.1 hypothetical protein TraAM80_07063 [Trypanosoma rangeli]|eukprot:RNF01318.1 hypothetical protein TraAM80_07063 [Trypanosoma rangeli]
MRRIVKRVTPDSHLLVLFLFAITYCVNILNWVFYLRYTDDKVDDALIAAHLAFSVIGCILFFLFASPLIYWSYVGASEMMPQTRRNTSCIAVSLCFFFHDLPVGWIELYLVWLHGWRSILSSVSLFIVWLCFAVGFFGSWIGYIWFLSRRLQFYYGTHQ